jgi:hypothetical protein
VSFFAQNLVLVLFLPIVPNFMIALSNSLQICDICQSIIVIFEAPVDIFPRETHIYIFIHYMAVFSQDIDQEKQNPHQKKRAAI